ncbi:MAG: class I SAM-dependent methyltransferase, partial [Candidatus Aenigmarchaeota archaeon]|nr:class I SAM-dependent methyltransferase [Candidatus Aenigmarchaeota archaeon]
MENKKLRFKKIIKIAQPRTGEKILDLGCYEGTIKSYIPFDVDYTGIDIKKDGKNIIKYDLEKGLPSKIKNKKFDLIFMNEFIEHIENFKTLLLECKKILKKDGRIIISTPSNNRFIIKEEPTHIHCFRKTNMENLARICGLKITKIIGTYIRIPILNIYIPTNQTIYT